MITRNFRREQKRKRVMAYFINATIELMEEIGIENLTIRKVAERAKYNSATLYNYFDSLDELEMFASVKCLNEYVKTSQHPLLLLHPAHYQRRRLRGQDHVLRPDLRLHLRPDHLPVRLRTVLQVRAEQLAEPPGRKEGRQGR